MSLFPIKKITDYLSKGYFAKNFLILTSTSGLSILIQFVFTPILSRVYAPADYADFAIYNLVWMFASLCFTAGYNQALIPSKSQYDFKKLIQLSFWSGVIFSVLWYVVLLFLSLLTRLEVVSINIGYFYFLIPFFLFLYFGSEIYVAQNIRNSNFKHNAVIRIIHDLTAKIASFSFSPTFLKLWPGIILSDFVGKTIMFASYKLSTPHFKIQIQKPKFRELVATAKQYINFPRYIVTTSFLSFFNGQFYVIVIPILFSKTVLGIISLSTSFLDLPLKMFGYSLGSLYAPLALEHYHNDKAVLRKLFYKTNLIFLLGGIIFMLGLFYWGDLFFTTFLGEKWEQMGTVCLILSPTYITLILSQTYNYIFIVAERQRYLLYLELLSILLKALAFLFSYQLKLAFTDTLILFSCAITLVHLLTIYLLNCLLRE